MSPKIILRTMLWEILKKGNYFNKLFPYAVDDSHFFLSKRPIPQWISQ